MGVQCGRQVPGELIEAARDRTRPKPGIRLPRLTAAKRSLANAVVAVGTSFASCCITSHGGVARCVVPSRQGVLSLNSSWLAEFHCTRLSDTTGRVMQQQSCSRRALAVVRFAAPRRFSIFFPARGPKAMR